MNPKRKLREQVRRWRRKNRGRVNEIARQWRRKNKKRAQEVARQYNYGLTPEEFEVLYLKQNSKCACCRKFLLRPTVDHCHKTGKIRGLLCRKCNAGIGFLGDSIGGLKKAIKYLSLVKATN